MNIIYYLTVEDIQNCAEETLGRTLTEKEVAWVDANLGDYMGWFESVASCLEYLPKEEEL